MRRPSVAVLWGGLLYGVGLAVVGLWPQHVDRSLTLGGHWLYGPLELAANIALFVPLGAFAMLSTRRMRWRWAVAGALVLSGFLELVQSLALPGRTGSVQDVLANTVGAALGAALIAMGAHRAPSINRPLRVLIDVSKRGWVRNPYIWTLTDQLRPDTRSLAFDWETAHRGTYDLVHAHWPEHLLRPDAHQTPAQARLRWLRWMWRLHTRRVPVVQTSHNRQPHDPLGRIDRLLLAMIRPRIRGHIWLTHSSLHEAKVAPGPCEVVIPHGSYEPWFARKHLLAGDTPRPEAPPVTLACIGRIKPYKNFEDAITAVHESDDVTLTIAGAAPDGDYLERLVALAGDAAHIDIRPGRLKDKDLVALVRASHAVLVPYEHLYNSGVVFVALTLDRPVIAQDNPMTRELRDEYGSQWVGLYEGPLTPEGLRHAWESVSRAAGRPGGSAARAWPDIARAHAALYRTVVGGR